MTTTVACTCGRAGEADWRTHGIGCPARTGLRLGVELVDPDRDRRVLRRVFEMLRAARHQPDPTVAGALVDKATLAAAAHFGESLASAWTAEEEGDNAADEDRIERMAA